MSAHKFDRPRTTLSEFSGTFTAPDREVSRLLRAFVQEVPGISADGTFALAEDMPIRGQHVSGVIPAGTLIRLHAEWPADHHSGDADVTLTFRAPVDGSFTASGASLEFGDQDCDDFEVREITL